MLLISLVLFGSTSGCAEAYRSQLEEQRYRVAAGELNDERAKLELRYTLDLIANNPIDVDTPLAAAFRAEQLRGIRLRDQAERAATVWSTLDAVQLPGNATETSIVWPPSDETWDAERAYVPPLRKRTAAEPTSPDELQRQELEITRQALRGNDWSPQHEWRLMYHAAILAHRMGEAYTLPPHDTQAPESLAASAELLRLEQQYHAGVRDTALLDGYERMESALPEHVVMLRIRRVQIAAGRSEVAHLQRILAAAVQDNQEDIARYALANLLLQRKRAPSTEVLDIVSDNADIVRDRTAPNVAHIHREALGIIVALPFSTAATTLLKKVFGETEGCHQLHQLARVALSQKKLEWAHDAFSWLATRDDSIRLKASTGQAMAAAWLARTKSLRTAVRTLRRNPVKQWKAITAILTQTSVFGRLPDASLAELEAISAQLPLSPALKKRLQDSFRQQRERVPQRMVVDVEIALPAMSPPPAVVTPPLSFRWAEVSSIAPLQGNRI